MELKGTALRFSKLSLRSESGENASPKVRRANRAEMRDLLPFTINVPKR
jgi:hypothetical protein